MIQWIVSASALILAVLMIRALFKNKISQRLRYALWLLVLARLLLPFSVGSSEYSVASYTAESRAEITYRVLEAVEAPREEAAEMPLPDRPAQTETAGERGGEKSPMPLPGMLDLLWLSGAALVLAVLLGANLHFAFRLHRSRKPVEADCPLPVYACQWLETPCLFGLFRPAIYLSPETRENPQRLRHVLLHEFRHYRQGDSLWAALRLLCLALHWYNPLVWLAAILSRRDGELACDEAVMKRLQEEERADYGRTLLTLSQKSGGFFLRTAAGMNGGLLRERIRMIAGGPRRTLPALLAVMLLSALAVGCSFAGEEAEPDSGRAEVPQATPSQELPTPTYSHQSSLRSADGSTEFVFEMKQVAYQNHMPALSAQLRDMSVQEARQLTDFLFGDRPLYELTRQHNGLAQHTREELDEFRRLTEMLQEDEALRAALYGENDSLSASQLENLLPQLQNEAYYEMAPAEAELKEVELDYGVSGRVRTEEKLFYSVSLGRSDRSPYLLIRLMDDGDALFYNDMVRHQYGNMEPVQEEQYELVAKRAEEILRQLGKEGYQLDLQTISYQKSQYIQVQAFPRAEGFPVQDYRPTTIPRGIVNFEFRGDGTLLYLQCRTDIQTLDEGEELPLLDFEACMAAVEEHLQSEDYYGEITHLGPEDKTRQRYTFTGLRQKYVLLSAAEDGVYEMTPVIQLQGKCEILDAEGNVIREDRYHDFMCFHAVDGGRIRVGDTR